MGRNGAITNENKKMRELLRYLVPLTDGFSIVQEDGFENIIYSNNVYIFKQRIIGFQNCLIYPQLLQSAIEGVNRENGAYRIEHAYNMIEVLDSEEYNVIFVYEFPSKFSISKAKEAALKYIYEQETGGTKWTGIN